MQRSLTFMLACTALVGGIVTSPATAQYGGPRGHSSSAAAFSRSINGIPCGVNCTARHYHRLARPNRTGSWNAYYRH